MQNMVQFLTNLVLLLIPIGTDAFVPPAQPRKSLSLHSLEWSATSTKDSNENGPESQSSPSVLQLPVREQFWLSIPHISAWNIYSNFTDKSLRSLEDAVAELVDIHPILAGRLVRRVPEGREIGDDSLLGPSDGLITEIHPGLVPLSDMFHFVNDNDSKLKNPTKLLRALDDTLIADAQKAAREELEPYIQEYSLKKLIEDETQPMFQVVVGKLTDDRTWVMVEVAHVIADGASFYIIHEALNNIIHGKDIPEMEFRVADEHIAYPKQKSERDKFRTLLGWLPTSIKALEERKQVISSFTMKKDIVAYLKVSFAQEAGVPFLSTNDVLMSSFADIYAHHDVMCMLCNMRDRDPFAKARHIGNFDRTIMFPMSELTQNVAFIRSYILGEKGKHRFDYYDTDSFPDLSKDLFGSVTNWVRLTKFLYPVGATLDLHLPTSSFLANHGLDVILVWNPIDGVTSIMTNMCEDTLAQNVKRSKLFKHIFGI